MLVLWHRHMSLCMAQALITNIPRVRDLEETISCPRLMATNTFIPVTFFLT